MSVNILNTTRRYIFLFCIVFFSGLVSSMSCQEKEKIGVLYVLHGGADTYSHQMLFDAALQMFAHDPNHPVYNLVIWNSKNWHMVMEDEFSVKFARKYEFQYPRIGGVDPFHELSDLQMMDMQIELNRNTNGIHFEVDFANWMSGDRPENYPYPRFMYNGPDGSKDKLTYCGEDEEDGPWQNCDSERHNVDGPIERLLEKGVSKIIAIDMAVGGIRFYKPFDVIQMSKRVLDDWNQKNGTSIPILWVNDYSNLMERSYPVKPEGWTPFLGDPEEDSFVLLNGSPNPVAEDPDLALLHVEGIEAGMSPYVGDAKTGVVIFNHGLFDPHRAYFDPKINDTNVLNENIKSILLERHPNMDPDNIIGAYGGNRETNPENNIYERTRPMRGEDLAFAGLHQSKEIMPPDPWGYRYWDAFEYLKDRGVEHIVIAFSQVITDSVLTLVEYYNQIGKEIGIKTWLYWDEGNVDRYPGVGHPFTDYWGNWVNTDCGGEECCFTMGGCDDGGTYPPPRQTSLNMARKDMDPSLAFELSDYGHIGYDPELGPPDPNRPVQNQYTGTWEVYTPPSGDFRVGKLLAKHVLNAAINPFIYITNGEIKAIESGSSVTWNAHTVSGLPPYSYQWSIKKEGDLDWTEIEEESSEWIWATPETGTYSIKSEVTDSRGGTGAVTWKGFTVF